MRPWPSYVRTPYPLVDAAARQLLSEGFVHNRARMDHRTARERYLSTVRHHLKLENGVHAPREPSAVP